jgi:P-type E1-E2 ATPase
MCEYFGMASVRTCFQQEGATLIITGKYISSGDLVPGDVYELSDPNLTQFPSDGLLLTGDCIVNESMLTGKPREFPEVNGTC